MAVSHINDNMEQFNGESARIMSSSDDCQRQKKTIIECCRRQIIGNVWWSLRNNRYSNKDFVASRCLLPMSVVKHHDNRKATEKSLKRGHPMTHSDEQVKVIRRWLKSLS